jgi:hypothetical protein
MTGAMFRFILRTIAMKISGVKALIDRVRAIQGPKNIPATDAERNMLMTSQIFKGTPEPWLGWDELSKRFLGRSPKSMIEAGSPAIS